MKLIHILRCPRTGNRLRFDDGDSVVRVHDSDVTYPIVDGIVDFCPEVKDKISKAYDGCSSLYDAYMAYATSPGLFGKIFDRLVWGFSGDGGLTDEVLSHLPAEFDGVLLDVPVGTGLFTCSHYARFPDATIVAVDYSMGMLQEAKKRFLEHGVNNVHLFRANVANLPVTDGAVNIVLSMAGLHAFRDKQGGCPLGDISVFEHRTERLLSRPRFVGRLGIALVFTLVLIGVSVTAGTIGYHVLAGYDWDDAFHQSCLVLGDHSVERHPENTAGKAFAGVYVMYARLVFLSVAAILIIPILHRLLHRLHMEVPTEDSD